jgi:hypothetical protein
MKSIKWALCGAAVFALCAAAMVRAQVDDLFGTPDAAQGGEAETTPASPSPVEDLFGEPAASPKRNQNQPAQAPAAENDPFGPSTSRPATAPVPYEPVQPTMQRVPDEANNNFCRCEGESNLAAVTMIEQTLSTPLSRVGVDFADTPLQEVADYFQAEYKIPIQIDAAALDENGIGVDAPVSINLQGISLRSALRLILKPLQLVYVIDNEVLVITTSEDADRRLKVCVYDVRDLIDGQPAIALSELTNVITASISSDSWVESGRGQGSIRSYPPNLLVIAQPQGVHEQIQDLLKRMRQMRQRTNAPAKTTPTPVPAR